LRLSPDTLNLLETCPWPGNVRELENALEYAVALCTGQTIQIEDLPPELRGAEAPPPQGDAAARRAVPPAENPPDPESERIVKALAAHRWNRNRAAKAIGVSRSTLWRRMRELGIE
jgi:transcriptional regulator of acetoin/glycerol metabolism